MSKPLLSIAMIFKNEIRCLERCLKSLQPLREAIPCELVMADTGSDDGSREVAERYADILIDFPWVNDFSAARNAALERCSGKWHFHIDADEWLDEDFSQLVDFLCAGKKNTMSTMNGAMVVQRNYMEPDLQEDDVRDFYALRLCRMSPGLRFHGSIHENYDSKKVLPNVLLRRVVLHHDGYCLESKEQKEQKTRRNVELLREELEREPEDMVRLLQFIESGRDEPDVPDLLRRAVTLVEERKPGWETFGPSILRYAVYIAQDKKLPELETWTAWAEEWFPNSFFTRIDVEYICFTAAWDEKDYEQCVLRGERYLQAREDHQAGRGDLTSGFISTLIMDADSRERTVRIFLAASHLYIGEEDRAVELLGQLDGGKMEAGHAGLVAHTLYELHGRTTRDTAPLISAFWEQISQPQPNEKRAEARKNAVYGAALTAFAPKNRVKEAEKEEFCRYAYTLYLPLRDKCEPGRAAAILETEDAAEMAELLSQVERWDVLPIEALARALEFGVAFPLPDKPLSMEEMDGLAVRLAADKEQFFTLVHNALAGDFTSNAQALLWARGLSMAAARVFDWSAKNVDADAGLSVARDFARTEQAFLPFCYTSQVLREENLSVLPPMHRFGWYCIQAFEALDSGDAVGYVRLLRSGLGACRNVKDTVEFLLDHTPELREKPEPSAELMALAEQIRSVLANFAPDDPAVAALKQSEAYQKVAEFIEGAEVPVMGGVLQ